MVAYFRRKRPWVSRYQTSRYYPSRKRRRYGKPTFSNYKNISDKWGRYSVPTTRTFGGQVQTRDVLWGPEGQMMGPWSPVL